MMLGDNPITFLSMLKVQMRIFVVMFLAKLQIKIKAKQKTIRTSAI